ncbi:hypothetical protein [Shimia ponticola]|uniref:hypothetical protein n=1 Tax=Shimia ponticola TaxID=2582893 RepID=UPI0011BF9D7C|nr:hypothetical protein [Shimia ponticola]
MRVIPLALLPTVVFADPATVVDAQATMGANGSGSGATTWRFDVTVSHPDTGWDHYADGWEIRMIDGTVLGTRPLAHPHVNEQPFTRSLTGVVIPEGTDEILIFVRDNVSGWAPEPFRVTLPQK